MPEYLYLCEVNNQEFEETHSIKIELEECNVCKEKSMPQHKPKRLIASANPGKVILTGHELAAKDREDTIKFQKEVYSNEQLYANIVGPSRYETIQRQMDKNRR